MSNYNNDIQTRINKFGRKIIIAYKHYGIKLHLGKAVFFNNRFTFEIILVPGNKVSDIKKHEKDVQMQLKLSLFQVHQDGFSIYIVMSKYAETDNDLMRILTHSAFDEAVKNVQLPYVVGLDLFGAPVIVDLSKMPNYFFYHRNKAMPNGLKACISRLRKYHR